ncbi:MAG: hypothetical protein ABIH11_08910 [Candidatus Altiarchaeota archaeon]
MVVNATLKGTMAAAKFAGRGDLMFKKSLFLGFIPPHILWNIGVIIVVALIFYWLTRGSKSHDSSLEMLKKRYVSGEIDKDTFLKMKEDIAD